MLKGDYKLGGTRGHHVSLWDKENFNKIKLNKETVPVYGHIEPRPKVGQTLVGEFQKSFIKFEFVSIEYCSDPPDMFFADVKAIEQEMK
jgi:hypothetical protein